MEQKEIQAHTVILEVTDETTGETFRRELPIDFYENANFLRLRGEGYQWPSKRTGLSFLYRNSSFERPDGART